MRRCTAIAAALAVLLSACATAGEPEPRAERRTEAATVPVTSAEPSPTASTIPEPVVELSRGGQRIFPEHRLVGFSGGRGASFGRLGIGNIDERAAEIKKLAARYSRDGRTPLPISSRSR